MPCAITSRSRRTLHCRASSRSRSVGSSRRMCKIAYIKVIMYAILHMVTEKVKGGPEAGRQRRPQSELVPRKTPAARVRIASGQLAPPSRQHLLDDLATEAGQ